MLLTSCQTVECDVFIPLRSFIFCYPSLWEMDRNGLFLWSKFPVGVPSISWEREHLRARALCLGLPVEWCYSGQGVPQTDLSQTLCEA